MIEDMALHGESPFWQIAVYFNWLGMLPNTCVPVNTI